MEKQRSYIAIDLKSFYASVECADRGLDPLGVNLVVADMARTEKTICLAVSPSLKAYGIPGRARLFEVVQRVKEINAERRAAAPGRRLNGSSYVDRVLKSNPDMAVDYIVAPPQMRRYMEISTKIYQIYLRFIAPEDIHVYSVDEVFIDATDYLKTYGLTARELAIKMIRQVLSETGITATAGIGTNLYLCKIAMDIVAKHMPADKDGVRIAELDEMSYRQQLWDHVPLTDFWRIGKGISNRLAKYGIYTMGDVARCSIGSDSDFYNEDLLYKLFGVNAELLIDHAWGWEPCLISDIKKCVPENRSISQGQVLTGPYTFEKARIVIREMTENLVLDLVEKGLVTDQMVLTVGYDIECLSDPAIRSRYHGETETDRYGRRVPKMAHSSINIGRYTSSTVLIASKVYELFDSIVNPDLLVRRMYVVANHVIAAGDIPQTGGIGQMDLFTDYEAEAKKQAEEETAMVREHAVQQAVIDIKKKFGKNAIIKGTNLQEGATGIERNRQVGGHRE